MKTSFLIKTAVAAALLMSGSAFAAPAELISDGSFESVNQASGTWNLYNSITGWTGLNNIEVRNNVEGTAADGHNFVELDTDHNSAMTQLVQTQANTTYTLSFMYQDRINVAIPSQGLSVSWGGATVGSVGSSALVGNGWVTQTYTLQGDGTAKALTFAAIGTSDSYGTSLDKISMTAAVPEPETYGMMLLGLGLVGFIARRKASK